MDILGDLYKQINELRVTLHNGANNLGTTADTKKIEEKLKEFDQKKEELDTVLKEFLDDTSNK